MAQNSRPQLEILDEVPSDEGNFWEREYISLYKLLGFVLLNSNPGGSGPTTHSENAKAKIGATHRGIPKSKIQCEKTSAALLGHCTLLETRQKISHTLTGRKDSLETRNRKSDAQKIRQQKLRDSKGGF